VELQNALRQIDELKSRNKELEEKLQLEGAGKRNEVAKQKDAKCMVMGDSILSNVEAEYTDMMGECFSWIRAEKLHTAIEKRDLGNPETVIIHLGANDL
jgi:hypothetical protein